MNRMVVVYQSKYGATKRYAHWLSEELSCDFIETKKAQIEEVRRQLQKKILQNTNLGSLH